MRPEQRLKRLLTMLLATLALTGQATPVPAERSGQPPASAQTRVIRWPHAVASAHPGSGSSASPALRLRPGFAAPPLDFSLRADETVTQASARLSYAFAPGLSPSLTHLRVLLNGEVVATVPMPRDGAGPSNKHKGSGQTAALRTQDIALDPTALQRYNQLRLELVADADATASCPAPGSPRPDQGSAHSPAPDEPWADIAADSAVRLTVRRRSLPNDLGLLPEPFLDRADVGPVSLPFVFAAAPSDTVLRAAGITASWFGMLAPWHRPRFPVHVDELPTGHAVVFATNRERPAALAQLPPFSGPELRVLDHPTEPLAKLLLIGGRDDADLARAAQALALGSGGLSGAQARVHTPQDAPPRQAYDAPNWVRLDRPMRFGELVDNPAQLQVQGQSPPPVALSLRLPPDLFTWRSRGVPVDLKLRYTPPGLEGGSSAREGREAQVTLRINGEAVQTMRLSASGRGGTSARVVLPLLDAGLMGDSRELLIPAFKLGSRNQLDYVFDFGGAADLGCGEARPGSLRALIDADSRIDFSGHPHYAEMPHLGYFATSGFPFTIHADLGQTVALLPETPAPREIEVLLALLARMGETTGYPATRLQVMRGHRQGELGPLRDRDLLMVGTPQRLPLLQSWHKTWEPLLAERHEFQAAVLGFESPLTPRRSVVAVTATTPESLTQVLDLLDQDGAVYALHGGAVLLPGREGTAADSIPAPKGYTTGELPFWTAVWYPLSRHPVLLALMAVLAVLVLAFALWRSLNAAAQRRLGVPEA
ncbi:cellulose synthase regulator protein [Hylemonella gracilis ATCC 19624]|uniref:Cyclic di-GMP-binding protein n=2 Tax=Hylemonella gracilis TaxID=80880 RepID=F3KSF6_9BURK|nr:cellulose synthase regulator protein [Hylemonella gracilis ATCC 19624]